MRSATTIERRISAIEQLPRRGAIDLTVPRDPRDLTSLDIHTRGQELRQKAIALKLERELGRAPTPAALGQAIERHRVAREARLDVLAATLAFPPGTPPETIAAYLQRKAEARARRLAALGMQNEDQDDDDPDGYRA